MEKIVLEVSAISSKLKAFGLECFLFPCSPLSSSPPFFLCKGLEYLKVRRRGWHTAPKTLASAVISGFSINRFFFANDITDELGLMHWLRVGCC